MSDISKFYSDVQRILKHDRADHAGVYDGLRAAHSVAHFFEQKTAGLAELPQSITKYWLDTYIKCSTNIQTEPSDKHIEWLQKVLLLLHGEFETEMDFPKKDWQELASITDSEAEELPLDVLSDLMRIFVSRKVI